MMKVVTLGELMMRLAPPGHTRFAQTNTFDVTYGGSEANVAATLAQFGLEAAFVTRLPEHAVGEAALAQLRKHNINTAHIGRGGNRLGIYFLEHGASQRPSLVVYDRAGSALAEWESEEVDWDAVMDGARWFHVSGITPALGERAHRLTLDAARAAQEAGATVSCDLNYRAKLWTVEEAQAVMRPLMEHVDVCIANEEDAWRSLGMRAEGTDHRSRGAGRRGVRNASPAAQGSLRLSDGRYHAARELFGVPQRVERAHARRKRLQCALQVAQIRHPDRRPRWGWGLICGRSDRRAPAKGQHAGCAGICRGGVLSGPHVLGRFQPGDQSGSRKARWRDRYRTRRPVAKAPPWLRRCPPARPPRRPTQAARCRCRWTL